MHKRSFLGGALMVAAVSLLLLGAGCGKKATNSNANTNSSVYNQNSSDDDESNSNTATEVDELGEPTGDEEEDQQAVEDALDQMKSASDDASQAVDEVENGESVDSYELPQDVE